MACIPLQPGVIALTVIASMLAGCQHTGSLQQVNHVHLSLLPGDPDRHSTLEIRIPGLPEDIIGYRFPEGIKDIHSRLVYHPKRVPGESHEEWRTDQEHHGRYFRKTITCRNGLDLEMRAIPDGSRIMLEITVANHSMQTIQGMEANLCLMANHAPSFRVPDMSRTWIYTASGFTTIKELAEDMFGRSYPRVQVWPENEFSRYRENYRFWRSGRQAMPERHGKPPLWVTSPVHPTKTFICWQSRDAQWILGTYWKRISVITTNATNPCIHSQPCTGSIPPGKTVTLRGVIRLVKGGLADFLALYEQDMQSM